MNIWRDLKSGAAENELKALSLFPAAVPRACNEL
jgi:hypothetical protein